MRRIEVYDAKNGGLVRDALKLIALTMVRPGELRLAEWTEFDETNRSSARRSSDSDAYRKPPFFANQSRTDSGCSTAPNSSLSLVEKVVFPAPEAPERPILARGGKSSWSLAAFMQ